MGKLIVVLHGLSDTTGLTLHPLFALLFAALYSSFLKIVPHDRLGRGFGLFYGMFNVGMIAGQSIGRSAYCSHTANRKCTRKMP